MFKCSQRGEKVSKGHCVWLSCRTRPDTNHLCYVSIIKQSCNMNQSCNKTGDSPAEEGGSFTSVCVVKFPVLKPQTENSFQIPGLTFDPVLLPSVFSVCKSRPSVHPAREFPFSTGERKITTCTANKSPLDFYINSVEVLFFDNEFTF